MSSRHAVHTVFGCYQHQIPLIPESTCESLSRLAKSLVSTRILSVCSRNAVSNFESYHSSEAEGYWFESSRGYLGLINCRSFRWCDVRGFVIARELQRWIASRSICLNPLSRTTPPLLGQRVLPHPVVAKAILRMPVHSLEV